MDTLYLVSEACLKRKENTLRLITGEGRNVRMPIEGLQHVIATGPIDFNSDLVRLLGQHRVRVSILDYYGNFSGSVEPRETPSSGAVHLRQAEAILDPHKRLSLARTILEAGIHNLCANLRYHLYRGKQELKAAIEEIEGYVQAAANCQYVDELMGFEGLARQTYYAAWGRIAPELSIRCRTRRPPTDRINCLISFCNALVYSLCRHELSKSHLDPSLSFIHSPNQARASLALDLAELFKPVIADRIIFRLVNRGQIKDQHFEEESGICLLNEAGRRMVVSAFREKVEQENLGKYRGYRFLVLREVFAIQAHLLGISDYKPFRLKV